MTAGLGIDARSHLLSRIVIVLAAGEGKRMRSALPKVLHPLLGRTMVGHVLSTVGEALEDADTVVVVGKGADQVREHVARVAPPARTALQEQQLGTGHAVRIALANAEEASGTVVVLNGDIPLLRAETLRSLVEDHERDGRAATVLTAEVDNPSGLGRVVRGEDGTVRGIVEERDATPEQRAIREINAGAYVFDAAALQTALGKLRTDNDQGEEYLTDVFGILIDDGLTVAAYQAPDATETLGANDRAELATLRALMRDRINLGWMRAGVSIIDPATSWIDVTVTLEPDATIEPNTHLCGMTLISSGAMVGPDTTITDTSVGRGAMVTRSQVLSSVIGERALVGPFAYLPAGTRVPATAAPDVAQSNKTDPNVNAPGGGDDDEGGLANVLTAGGR